MSEVKQEKDYFWFYVGGIVLAAIVTVVLVKGSEHDKYETAAKAISEDAANSAYYNKK
jgi:bacteriorhodopsin